MSTLITKLGIFNCQKKHFKSNLPFLSSQMKKLRVKAILKVINRLYIKVERLTQRQYFLTQCISKALI